MRLITLPILALAACTSSNDNPNAPDQRGAAHAFTAASTRMDAAVGAIGNKVASAGTVTATAPCELAGSVGLTGSIDSVGARTKLDLTAAFTGCKEDEGVLDGSLRFTSITDGSKVSNTWNGSLHFTDLEGSWQCAFDVQTTVDATGVHNTGSVCGYDVKSDLGL
jgi:hypothetical protein